MGVRSRRGSFNQRQQQKKKKEAEHINHTMQVISATKMVSLLALRNEGWGKVRLARFSEDFDEIMNNVSQGLLSTSDIPPTILEETGLDIEELSFKYEEDVV